MYICTQINIQDNIYLQTTFKMANGIERVKEVSLPTVQNVSWYIISMQAPNAARQPLS